jgi:hypothetical protein
MTKINDTLENETMTVTKALLVDIIVKHIGCNSTYKNLVGNFLNQDITSDEHLIELLTNLNDNKLEYLLLKI